VTYLSRTAKLGIAAETTDSVYVTPAFTIPFEHGTSFRDHIIQLHDNTIRGSDVCEQDIQQGPYWSDWRITTLGYPDWAGWLLRAMIGPDQYTPGAVTTFAAPAAPGATTITLTAAPPAGSVLMLGTGTSLEYTRCGTPAGTGPYTVPVTGLLSAHAAGDPARSQASHVFRQNRVFGVPWPSYSLTSDDGTECLGWPGCILGSVTVKVTDTGWMTLASTWNGFPPAGTATFTEAETSAQPPAGWSWQVTTAGAVSTRGKSLDLTLYRTLDTVTTLDSYQAPYGIFAGPMCTKGRYTAIFDSTSDLNLYRQGIQDPAVWTFTQPAQLGGSVLSLTLSRSGWTDGTVSLEEPYVTAGFSLAGIANTTDSPASGVTQASLSNFTQAAYSP
jgi:hypothetical protein